MTLWLKQTIQPWGGHGANKELTSIGVWASIGHGQDTGARVLQLKVFIRELGAIDGFATGAVVVGEVTTLAHELGNDTVEAAALVSKSLFTRAQCAYVCNDASWLYQTVPWCKP